MQFQLSVFEFLDFLVKNLLDNCYLQESHPPWLLLPPQHLVY